VLIYRNKEQEKRKGAQAMEDLLILVDAEDREIGYGEKMETHAKEQLHRAFSLFIFNENSGEMLIHRRAADKYHSGGLWTNACCSHPRKGEVLQEAVLRRMEEELGICPKALGDAVSTLRELGSFTYYHRFADCAEHEVDHVFLMCVKGAPLLRPDPDEIAETMWVPTEQLVKWLESCPEQFTAWFPKAFAIALIALPCSTERLT